MARAVVLSRGYVAVVDDEDYDRVAQHHWHAAERKNTVYAASKTVGLMHRLIANAQPDELVDHRDRDGLNNTRANLRTATAGQNAANAVHHRDGVSGLKGVFWTKATGRWRVRIRADGKTRHLGYFDSREDAARVYDAAAAAAHGEFARLNGRAE